MKQIFTLSKSVLFLALFLFFGAYSTAQNPNETTGQFSSSSLVTNHSTVQSQTKNRRPIRKVMAEDPADISVISTYPAAGAIDVPVNPVITVTFSEAPYYELDYDHAWPNLSDALSHGIITLQLNGTVIACTATSADDITATLTPSTSLLQNTTYHIVLDDAHISTPSWGVFSGASDFTFTTVNNLTKLDTTTLALTALTTQKVDFSWNKISGSTGYLVSIYNDGNLLSSSTIQDQNTTAYSFNLNSSATSQDYTLKIQALGDQITTSSSDLSTLSFNSTPLSSIVARSPRLTTTTCNFGWFSVTGAKSYTVILDDDILNPHTTTTPRYYFTGLTPSTPYTIHIVANSDSVGQVNSEEFTAVFTTKALSVKTWDAGSGTCSTQTSVTYLPAPIPTPPTHWEFFGWSPVNVTLTSTMPNLMAGDYSAEGNETFYAVYKSTGTPTYYATHTEISVTISVNNNISSINTNSALSDTDIASYATPYSNMVFKGWVTVELSASGQEAQPPYITFPIVKNTTLYAVYFNQALNKYYNTIPSIQYNITTDQDISALTDPYTMLNVKTGNTLTIDQATNVLSINVEQGASLNLLDAAFCNTSALTLEGDDRTTGQLLMPENASLNVTNGMSYKMNLADDSRFYYFSLPYACEKNAIILKDQYNALDPSFECTIYEHNSEGLSNGTSGDVLWVEVTGTLEANKGYIICSNQTKLISATFPSTMTSYANEAKNVAVVATSGTGDVAKRNWNFIGSSYLSNVGQGCTFELTGLPDATVAFVTQPDYNNNCQTYLQTKADEATILPFSAFFVQVKQDGNATFTNPNSVAPVRASQSNELKLSLATSQHSELSNNQDKLYLNIGNQYTTDYEIGDDLSKMLGYSAKPQFYSITNNTKLIYNSLPESAMNSIALGFYTGTTEKYTITAVNGYTFNANHIYLTDLTMNITTDLTIAPYQFDGKAGESNNDRFVLSIVRQETPTDLDQSNELTVNLYTQDHQIILNHLTPGSQLDIMDATGKIVAHHTVTNSSLQFPATSGMYLVRITQTNGQTTSYKTILK